MESNRYNLYSSFIQETLKQYYIVVRDTICTYLEHSYTGNGQILSIKMGTLVEKIGSENNTESRIRIRTKSQNETLNNIECKCYQIDLLHISPLIYKFLYSISNMQERIQLAKNKQFCKDIETVKVGSKVWYLPDPKDDKRYLVEVTFINSVRQFGDGYYFGLDFSNCKHLCDSSFSTKLYYSMFHTFGTFATLSNINLQNKLCLESIKNFEQNFLSNNILQPKNTDNFFIAKIKENTDSKRSLDVLKKNKCPLVDTDNNNQVIENRKSIDFDFIANYTTKYTSEEYQNHNKKLDKNLLSFDPLCPEHKWSSDIDLNVESNVNSETNYSSSSIHDNNYEVDEVQPKNIDTNKSMSTFELDDIHSSVTDGTYKKLKYLKCKSQKAWFTDLQNCYQCDMAASNCYYIPENQNVELIQNSGMNDVVPPIKLENNRDRICGKYRGIQGHHNSCYLDATLFSMFAFTNVFDNLLLRPPNEKDCAQYEEVQRVLREEIVNPLRRDLFVKADHVMKLRTLLEKSSSISGLTTEEKDPEEFLTSLVAQTLNAEPFLKLSSGQDAYHYQLFVEKDDELVFPSVQQLLEQSFLTSNVKLKEVPSCLILQMPRFGKSYKMYSKIQPTLLLDVTDIIEDSPRQCVVCGNLANYECKECYGQLDQGLESTAFCSKCVKKAHNHERRTNHEPNSLSIPIEYEMLKDHCPVQRLYLELLAVVCIETSHYVSFVKCAPGSDAPWCFFDSMADRKGEQNGHNIPEIMPCPDFPYWLSKEGASDLTAKTDDRMPSGYAKRLLCDAYMCMYVS